MAHVPSSHRRLLVALALSFAAACGGAGGSHDDPHGAGVLAFDATPIDPTGRADYLVDFGAVGVGDRVDRVIDLRNGGASALRLAPLQIAPPFATDHDAELALQPGESRAIHVQFAPNAAGRFETIVPLRHGGESVVLRLAGSAAVTESGGCVLAVDERPMNWTGGATCEPAQQLALANLGDAPCDVTLSIEGARFGVDRQRLEVGPRAVEFVTVARVAAHTGAAAGILHVDTDHSRWGVPLAAAAGAGVITDVFETPGRPKVDLLVVVDDSPAMGPFAEDLQTLATSAATYLLAQRIDFRWGVTTTSRVATESCAGSGADGRLLPLEMPERWLSPASPELLERVARSVDVGTCSTAPNEGFAAAWRAVSELDAEDDDPLHVEPADGHKGFVRRGEAVAGLRLVFVSARDDASADAVGDWAARFFSIHGARNEHLLDVFAFVAPASGCASAEAGTRYASLADQTNGPVADLCDRDSWRAALQRLGSAFPGFEFPPRYFLSDQPVDVDGDGTWDDDIELRLNGEIVAAVGTSRRWAYDPAANEIDFMPMFVPGPDTTIEVTYTPSCLGTP